jgi:hypothetical protein
MQIKHLAALAIALGSIVPVAASAQVPAAVPAQAPAAAPGAARAHRGGNRVNGVVQSNNNGTVTVTSRRDPTSVTFTITAETKIETSKAIASTDIAVNNAVRIEGTVSADGKSIDARRVTVLTALPGKGAARWGKVTPNGKAVEGTVTSVNPLTVTAGDGTTGVTVNPTLTAQYMQNVTAVPSDVATGVRIQATLNAKNEAREITIMPARARRGRKKVAN